MFLLVVAFLGFVLYYVAFAGPESDMVFRSERESEVIAVRNQLEGHGIRTYMKAISPYRSMIRHRVTPSLHVINQVDRTRALQIISGMTNK